MSRLRPSANDRIIEPRYSADLLHTARSANALMPAVTLCILRKEVRWKTQLKVVDLQLLGYF
jgi:hypothetical protein